jgi:hypothetical protein
MRDAGTIAMVRRRRRLAAGSEHQGPGLCERAEAPCDADRVRALRFIALRPPRLGVHARTGPVEFAKLRPHHDLRRESLRKKVARDGGGRLGHRRHLVDGARHPLGHLAEVAGQVARDRRARPGRMARHVVLGLGPLGVGRRSRAPLVRAYALQDRRA